MKKAADFLPWEFSTENEIFIFMKGSSMFRKTNVMRHWKIIDSTGTQIGGMWFKFVLGGWRMFKYSDTTEFGWKERGVIKSVKQLKELLK